MDLFLGVECVNEARGELELGQHLFIFQDEGADEQVSVDVALAEGTEWAVLAFLFVAKVDLFLFLG